jgi:hypothetical protein
MRTSTPKVTILTSATLISGAASRLQETSRLLQATPDEIMAGLFALESSTQWSLVSLQEQRAQDARDALTPDGDSTASSLSSADPAASALDCRIRQGHVFAGSSRADFRTRASS